MSNLRRLGLQLLLPALVSPAVMAMSNTPPPPPPPPEPETERPVTEGMPDHALRIRTREYAGQTDKVFVDGHGREITLRGFNVSGEVKLAENGFQPFASAADAAHSFDTLKQQTGANMVRYTVSWEGIHKQPDEIDYEYLNNAVSYIREAVRNELYVLVDYHSDLYSRHTFTRDSRDTGNGAPGWAVAPVNGKDDCGLPCLITWSAHKLSDTAVRNAMKSFWYDHWIMDRDLGVVKLAGKQDGRCMDISGGQARNSVTVVSSGCNDQASQRWRYLKNGTLHSLTNEGQCLDVAGARTSDNTDIQVYSCNGTRAQQFILSASGRLHSALDFNKCVASVNGNLKLNECRHDNRGDNQLMTLTDTAGQDISDQPVYSQTAFIWQLGKTAEYLRSQLTDEEFGYVLGFEPLNEPFDGGIGQMTYREFDNQLLWPFYERARAELDSKGIEEKPVYAEPMVFWSSIAGVTAPATGGHYLSYEPGDGFVFTPHFYDQGRMGVEDLSVARNGAHFPNIDQIRDEARYLNLATFMSEFGMWLDGYGHTDTARVVNGTYQAMESSDRTSGRDRFVDFYTPQVSGAQWQWDIYYDRHHEFQNGNPDNLKTEDDAWNGENFSVVRDFGAGYNVAAKLIERAYPRSVQGDTMHFAYEGLVPDAAADVMAYHAIRTRPASGAQKEYLRNRHFAMLVWKGRNSDAATEIYIPRHMQADNLTVVTDQGVFRLNGSAGEQQGSHLVSVQTDVAGEDSGNVVTIDDKNSGNQGFSYALVIDGRDQSLAELEEMRAALTSTINQQRSAVYLIGNMTHGGYPGE